MDGKEYRPYSDEFRVASTLFRPVHANTEGYYGISDNDYFVSINLTFAVLQGAFNEYPQHAVS